MIVNGGGKMLLVIEISEELTPLLMGGIVSVVVSVILS